MNAKVWIYSCLLLVSAGVGVPYALRSAGREAPPEPLDLPAEELPGEELVFSNSFDDAPVDPQPVAHPAQAPDGTSDPEGALARLESLLPRYGGGVLDRLARGGVDASALDGAGQTAAPGRSLLESFLAGNPFSGVLDAPSGAVALFGRRSLRCGDTLFDGRLRVHSIALRSVNFEIDGELLPVSLPPLTASRSQPNLLVDEFNSPQEDSR